MVQAASDEDQATLQAALAASQLDNNDDDEIAGPGEMLYKDGGTELFNAVEECKWTDALDMLEVAPELAGIWVKSTGTENTTFGWSLWRRLPIHEVRSIQ